jgi:hypothetical protein
VLEDGEAAEQGIAEADLLMGNLGIPTSNLIEGAYADLLRSKSA